MRRKRLKRPQTATRGARPSRGRCLLTVLGFGFWVLGFGLWVLGLDVRGLWVWGLRFGVWGSEFGDWSLKFRVWSLRDLGSKFWVLCSGFRVQGSGFGVHRRIQSRQGTLRWQTLARCALPGRELWVSGSWVLGFSV